MKNRKLITNKNKIIMKTNYFVIVTMVLLLAACGTIKNSIKDSIKDSIENPTGKSTKKVDTTTTKEEKKFTEVEKFGIKFSKIENFKNFEVIYLPYSGKGFRKSQDVDIDRNRTDNDMFVPGVRYNGQHFSKMTSISNFEGNLDEQYKKYNNKYTPIPERYKEFSEEQFTKTKIGDYKVGKFSIKYKMKADSETIFWTYGYLIMHNNKAAVFEVSELQVSLEEIETEKILLDKVFKYMIETVKFK